MGTNSSIAGGGFTAANARFSKEDHLRITLETGKGLSRIPLVKRVVEQGPQAMERLRSYGLQLWSVAPDTGSVGLRVPLGCRVSFSLRH